MKIIEIEKRKKHQHIIGKELQEKIYAMTKESAKRALDLIIDDDFEKSYMDDITAIYNLENGFYDIDAGDFVYYVRLEDANDDYD